MEVKEEEENYASEKYIIGKTLGKGASCEVVACKERESLTDFALKIMSRDSKVNMKLYHREIEVMRLLNHPNIIKFHETFLDWKNLYIVSELCCGGELFDRIVDPENYPMTERRASQLVRTMLLAIQHCHEKQVVHRDLKPENFVFKTPDQMSEMVLIDFGCARIVSDDTQYKDLDGTPYYLSPESAVGERYIRTGRVLKSSDVWAIGIIAFVLMTGSPPFDGKSNTEIFKRIVKQPLVFPRQARLSKSVIDFIRLMLKKSPVYRIKVEDALRHPWIIGEETSDKKFSMELIKVLRQFNEQSKFKQAVTRILVKHMEPQEKIQEHFQRLDKNNDGSLDVNELSVLLMDMGVTKAQALKEANAIIQTADVDGSGAIEFDEFSQIWQRKFLKVNEGYIHAVFSVLDADGGGTIDATELATVLDLTGDANKKVVEEIIKEVDTDGDGVINFEEFRNAMLENNFSNKGAEIGHKLEVEDVQRASLALEDKYIDLDKDI